MKNYKTFGMEFLKKNLSILLFTTPLYHHNIFNEETNFHVDSSSGFGDDVGL